MANKFPNSGNVLGIDYGGKRLGLALASLEARLPSPLSVIKNDPQVIARINQIIEEQRISMVVLGIPKTLEGNETRQSEEIRDFGSKLKNTLKIPILFADETLSSVRALQYLEENKRKSGEVDSIAACFILEEFLTSREEPR